MKLLIFSLLLCLSAYAQHSEQPLAESAADIRGQTVLFKIELLNEKKSFFLERTTNLEYFLKLVSSKKEEILKINNREAKNLDAEFAKKFLRCQYELESLVGACKVTLRLIMKGESQEICEKDDKKSQEMSGFIKNLNQRF